MRSTPFGFSTPNSSPRSRCQSPLSGAGGRACARSAPDPGLNLSRQLTALGQRGEWGGRHGNLEWLETSGQEACSGEPRQALLTLWDQVAPEDTTLCFLSWQDLSSAPTIWGSGFVTRESQWTGAQVWPFLSVWPAPKQWDFGTRR